MTQWFIAPETCYGNNDRLLYEKNTGLTRLYIPEPVHFTRAQLTASTSASQWKSRHQRIKSNGAMNAWLNFLGPRTLELFVKVWSRVDSRQKCKTHLPKRSTWQGITRTCFIILKNSTGDHRITHKQVHKDRQKEMDPCHSRTNQDDRHKFKEVDEARDEVFRLFPSLH